MRQSPVVALEIGTTKVVALVGELRENGRLVITGMGEHESKGVRKGEIVDLENAVVCVRSALLSAEESGQVTIREVHLAVSGGHIQSQTNRGAVRIAGHDGEITTQDIEQVKDLARAIHLPADRESLHTIWQHYCIDGQQTVANPEGLTGAQLSLDMLALHGMRARLENTIRSVQNVPMEVEDVVFSGLCSALAVLTPEQKEIGVLMIDLGGGTTDYVAYAGKTLATAGSLGVGGDHITNDIAIAFGIPLRQAEMLKLEWGRAAADSSTRSRRIDLPPEVGLIDPSVNMYGLHTVINARVEETLAMVRSRVESAGVLRQFGAGMVLTGGGARLSGILELAQDVFGLPCRLGTPRDVDGLAAAMEGPQYATAVGLARYGFQTDGHETPSLWHGIFDRFFGRR